MVSLWCVELARREGEGGEREDRDEDHRDVQQEWVRREAERFVDLDPPQAEREDRDGDERALYDHVLSSGHTILSMRVKAARSSRSGVSQAV